MTHQLDTIAAIATATGGGIGIIRLSGGDVLDIIKKIFKPINKEINFKSHRLYYGHIVDDTAVVDEVLVSFMAGPNSYTCEDVIEINCHGGIKCLKNVLDIVLNKGARLADPGEFTKRAFLNGRIDLTQAEAVIDMINAKTDMAQKGAMKRLSGSFSHKVNALRETILALIAKIEVSIDYPEHELEEDNLTQAGTKISSLIEEMEKIIKNSQNGLIIKEGIHTVIVGKPNVGKSSLLNVILDEERAIVTDIPGTTRDILREYVTIGGIPLKIVDTAGIRHTRDQIEKAGVEKSKAFITEADLVLMILDSSEELQDEDLAIMALIQEKKSVIVMNKSDRPSKMTMEEVQKHTKSPIVTLSAKAHSGIEKLYQCITTLFFEGEIESDPEFILGNTRDITLMKQSLKKLYNAQNAIYNGLFEDFIALDLMEAYGLLGEIIGETVGEEVLDKIFSEFCLGK